MKSKKIFIMLIIVICLIFTSCSKNSDEIKTLFLGEYKTENQIIEVEVLIEDNALKHIELLNSNNSQMQITSVYLFEDILKNSDNNLENYTQIEKELFFAVENAIENSGYDFDDLVLDKQTEIKQSYNYDVVIIGAGGAGLTSAIEAKNLGYENIVVLEKMSFAGGNTRMSNGCYAAPNNWNQDAEAQKLDSEEIFLKDLYEGGLNTGDLNLLTVIAENALENAYWLKDEIGVEFQEDLTWYEGHEYTRALRIEEDGIGLANSLVEKANEIGIEIMYTTTADELILNENRVVVGVRARRAGEVVEVFSNTGVILATGGFSSNTSMLKDFGNEEYIQSNDVKTTNSPAISGDGINMAYEVGAQLIDMSEIQFYPITNPATGNFYKLDDARLNDNAILVNLNGERFVNEHETRDVLSETIISQPKGEVYQILDPDTIKRMDIENLYPLEIEQCIELGVLYKGSLKGCAEYFGIPYENLTNTIEQYNIMASTGFDSEFQREGIQPISDGEFIMFSAISSVHHTMGGVKIDENAQVLNENGEIIKGLFAAGEVVGGIYGENRLGAAALPESIIFGRIAAQSLKILE